MNEAESPRTLVGQLQRSTVGAASGPSKRKTRSSSQSAFIFLLLAGSSFYADLAGQIYASEVTLLLYIIHTLIQRNSTKTQPPQWIVVGLILWAFGSLISDFAFDTEPLQATKGILRVFFLGVNVIGLFYLLGSSKSRITLAWAALCTSMCLAFVLQPNKYALDLPWKFSFGLPTSILVVLWLSGGHRRRRYSVPILMILSGVHFALGFRSMAIITAVAGLLLLVRSPIEIVPSNKRTVRLRPLVLALVSVGVVVTLTSVYDQLALDGQLGSAAQMKASYQADGAFGSLFSSRNEFFLSVASVSDSPFLGGGSYSVASREVAISVADLYDLYGYEHVAAAVSLESPAYHSELLSLWAENGILTVPFWLGVLVVYLRSLMAVLYRSCTAPALVAMISTIGIWDLFFSPFGADRRMWLALSLVTVIALTKRKEAIDAKDIYRNHKLQSKRLSASLRRQRPGAGF